MANSMQDLEQSILKCWGVVDDLKMLAKEANNGSDFTDALKGVAELYHYKFEQLWDEYEAAVKEYYAAKGVNRGNVE